jgi:hypothetical protein
MLLPENPEKRPGLWDAVARQLAEAEMCILIKEGVGNPLAEAKEPNGSKVELALARLRAAPICRISANRGSPVSPHFAGQREGDTVLITEFITYPFEGALRVRNEKLKRDLETAVINLFFAEGGVSTVQVPLHIAPWVMRDAEISLAQDRLVFRKRI